MRRHVRDEAASHDKGVQLERLMKRYLTVDPQYKNHLAEIWLWPEWPDRWGPDVGIDLVAREHGSGDYWAIQCKLYDPAHAPQKADIDSFFTASGKRFQTADGECGFSQRLIVATTDKWSKHAEQALENQTIPVTQLWFKDLADSPVDWSQFSLANVEGMRLTEQLTGTTGRVLFLTPSIALIAQALREWTAQAMAPIHAFAICSDTKVGRNAEDVGTQ